MKQIQEMIQERKVKGFAMAKQERPIFKDGVWLVRSQTNPRKTYKVSLNLEGAKCDCEDFIERGIYGVKCKHYWSVEYVLTQTEIHKDGSTTTTTITKHKTYSQPNWKAYDQAHTQQKDLFQKLLHDLCGIITEPMPKETGRPSLPISDMVFTSALKVYTKFSLRDFISDVREAQRRGYITSIPHYTMPSKYMRNEALTPILHQLITASAMPLKMIESSFSIDSSGFTPSKFSRWFDKKYNKVRDRKIWYKLHLVNGNSTHIVASCEITTQHVFDGTMLQELTNETHQNFNMQELCGDKAYMSDNNLNHLNGLNIVPYIPFKSNTVANNEKKSEIWRNAYNYFCFNQQNFLSHYHQRSNSETVFYMIKTKFEDYTRSKNNTACINEILLKVLCHNICVLITEMFELGIKPEFLGVQDNKTTKRKV
jgi:transposase